MAECFYCEKDNEKRKALMLDVCELPYSIVYLFRDQKNKGRCVVAFKGHKTEYFQLTPEENAGYFADVAKVAKVLGAPEGQTVAALIAIGHPAQDPVAPPRKSVDELLTVE